MTDLELAIHSLEGHTLALCKDGKIITSNQRGVAPMVDFIREGKDLSGYVAADRVVGKAAAMMFVLAGVKSVFAKTLSEGAKQFLDRHGIAVGYGEITPHIRNREGTGLCPMELTVADIEDAEIGFCRISERLDAMRKQKT